MGARRGLASRSVLFVHDSLYDTGSIRWANTLTERWIAGGDRVTLFCILDRQDGQLASAPAGAQVVFGGAPGQRLRRAIPRSVLPLVAAVHDADVVLVASEVGWSVPLAHLTARLCGRPLLVMVQSILEHSTDAWVPRWRRGWWRHCIRHAAAVTSVSPGAAESVRRLGVPPERVSVIPPGRDVEDIQRRARAHPAVHTGLESPVVVAVGELVKVKAHDVLLRAIAAAHRRGTEARLLILGAGPQRLPLARLAAELGIADRVRFAGFVAEPYPDMLAADLFCLSSRFEGLPLCLLEALALGLPIVATDAIGGGPRVLLDGGRLGDLVPPGSVEALEGAIVRHLEHPEVLRHKAEGGPDQARRFSPSASAQAYQTLFEGLSTGSSAARSRRPTAP